MRFLTAAAAAMLLMSCQGDPSPAAIEPKIAPILDAPVAVDIHSYAKPLEARVTHLDLDLAVDFAAKRVADVMQQGGDDIALALARAMGSGRGLQAVLQPVDRKAAIITVEQSEVLQDTIRQACCEGHELRSDRLPVLGGRFLHRAEGGVGHMVSHRSPLLGWQPS